MKTTSLLLVLMVAIIFSSCTARHVSKAYSSSTGWNYANAEQGGLADFSRKEEEGYDPSLENFVGMKVYNASMEVKVKDADSTVAQLTEIAKANEGYVSNSNTWATTLKVKAAHLEQAMSMVKELGKVTDRSISVDDITAQYNDVEIRLDNAEKARLRYLELLAKAENVEAALKVEKELERLNGEIDLLKGQLNLMKHQEQYSTLTVRINERDKLGVLGYVFVGAYKGVRWLFVRE